MKIRLGFVSNSSSASYVVTIPTVTTTTTVTTTVSGSDLVTYGRSGIETYAQERWDELGRVTSVKAVEWEPWARSRAIVIYTRGLIPNSQMFIFIEQNNVSKYFNPAYVITMTGKTGKFTDYKNTSAASVNLSERQYGTKEFNIIDRGEIITNVTTGGTAIAIRDEENKLYIVNPKGTWSVGNSIRGQTSGAVGTIATYIHPTTTVSTSVGSVFGVLEIPHDDTMKIPSGITTIMVRDAINKSDTTSYAETSYNAYGLEKTQSTTIMSVKNADIITHNVTQTNVVTQNWSNTTSSSSSVTRDV
jgi:hypothetical protein